MLQEGREPVGFTEFRDKTQFEGTRALVIQNIPVDF